ncbi:aspartic [Seminavis robusta]|uniref:Aspartic n=1 Tax=Seminavis robusta TaxID=568900 RepID=A0A9N8HQU5_9STRA|nr:aspartic [Seminavis robusta]|eukprot:Sro1235_g255040.1 aspartic (420) ;mRNA; f:24522-25891
MHPHFTLTTLPPLDYPSRQLANYHPNCIFAKAKKKNAVPDDSSCTFEQTYLEGSSWKAKEVEDMVWLATADQEESIEEYMPHLAIPFTFGCQNHVTGFFVHQYSDGILGMGKQMDKNSLLQSMIQAGAINRAAFAMCLSQTGGTLSFGGSGLARPDVKALKNPEQYHLGQMYFSKLTQDHGLYALDVYQVYIGDYCMTCDDTPDRLTNEQHEQILTVFGSGKGTLLDSARAAEQIFEKVWEEKVGSRLEPKRDYTYEEFLRMPIITVVFNPNATIHAHPCSYMEGVPMDLNATKPDVVQPWTGKRKLTIRLYMEENEGAVLGANFMYNYDVLYDLERQRVGFARANCGFDREAQARLNRDRVAMAMVMATDDCCRGKYTNWINTRIINSIQLLAVVVYVRDCGTRDCGTSCSLPRSSFT